MGALARSRTMHELAVNALVIADWSKRVGHTDLPQRFLDHEVIANYRDALVYQTNCDRLGFEPQLFQVSDEQLAREALWEGAENVPELLRGITLDSCRIETSGTLDLRGFLGLADDVPPGYRQLNYTVHIKGDGTPEQFAEMHQAVMKTSPNYFNMARPIRMNGTLSVG